MEEEEDPKLVRLLEEARTEYIGQRVKKYWKNQALPYEGKVTDVCFGVPEDAPEPPHFLFTITCAYLYIGSLHEQVGFTEANFEI
jgi:hypothetical protein